MASNFFTDLPKITDFIGVIDDSNFSPAPADWTIVVADIRSSTKAIAQGRYKDVNMIGGAVICAIQNATGDHEWPFVLGGDGATMLVKSDVRSERYAVRDYELAGLPDLTGLSCRWEALSTQKGRILCLLIKPQAQGFQAKQIILSLFMSQLTQVIGTELSQASPVTAKSLRFSWPPKGLAAEAKATRAGKSYVRRLLEISANSFIQWIMERFRLTIGAYNPQVYSNEMQTNSDYCKFDDVLRMVLDCTPGQVSGIRVILDDMHATGDVDFGFFETEQALMTCLLFDLNSSQHLHFIDGDNGGFCSASLEYKQQLASRE